MNKNLLRFDQDKKLVFFDAETFNLCLNFCHNLPWQIAFIELENNKIINKHDILIKWDTDLKISDEAAKITKYNHKKVQELGVPPKECFDVMKGLFDGADYILGHNIFGFDIYLVKEYYKQMNDPSWKKLLPKFIDTNCLAKSIKMDIPLHSNDNLTTYQYKLYHKKGKGTKTNLKALGKEYSIEHDYENLHNALVDLELNIKVWGKLKYSLNF